MCSPADRALSYDIANIPVLYQATLMLELCPMLCIYVSICSLAISYICVPTQKKRTNPIAWEPRVGGERQTGWPVTVLQGLAWSHYSVQVEASSNRHVLILGQKMSDCKSERVNIKFLVKLKKSTTETFQLLTGAYGEDCVSCKCVWMAQMIFGRQRKLEKWWSPRPSMHSCYWW
jgi:hypothetical protein